MRTETIEVPHEHPAFAGHFPGRPLLPGSLLLELILAASGTTVTRVSSAKLLRPVLPGDRLSVRFTEVPGGSAIRFSCTRAEETVCSGVLVPEV